MEKRLVDSPLRNKPIIDLQHWYFSTLLRGVEIFVTGRKRSRLHRSHSAQCWLRLFTRWRSDVWVSTDEYRTCGVVHNVVANAAHDGAAQFTEPPGAHYDKRRRLLLCDIADELSRLLKVSDELASDLNKTNSAVEKTLYGFHMHVNMFIIRQLNQ